MPLSNTPLIPKVAHRYATLASTNTAAIADINAGMAPTHGSVYWADAQTAGRGQGVNTWFSSPNDNLALSLVLYPDHLAVDRLFALTQLSALAVAEAVVAVLPPSLVGQVKVKWPNDIYVGDQKIAGILVQNGLRGSAIAWSVIGIGLNVNETNFPAPLTKTATSLRLLSGVEYNRETIAQRLFDALTKCYDLSAPLRARELSTSYHAKLYRRNEPTSFLELATGERFTATILGVDEIGRLRLRAQEGERRFALREIKLV